MSKLKLGIISSVIGLLLFVALVTTVNMAKADYNHMYYGTVIKQDGNILIIELDKMDEPPMLDGFGLELRPVNLGGNNPDPVITPTPGCHNPDENPNC